MSQWTAIPTLPARIAGMKYRRNTRTAIHAAVKGIGNERSRAVSQQQFDSEVSRQEWEEMQDAPPPHKREGYAEMMYEMADMRRKAEREDALLRSEK